jgi:hypothetical protein
MTIDDEIRSVIKAGGADNQIKQAQRKQRGRLLQEMALAQVQAGETSVEEVLRVLKSDSESGGSGHRSRGGSPPVPPGGSPPRGAAPPRGGGPPARGRSPQPRPAGP